MKQSYHHGDLKQAALVKAAEILSLCGMSGLSLRVVAKELGVSAPALYSHFANKDSLLEALAVMGYQLLSEQLDACMALVHYPVLERLAIGYVGFALDNGHLFRLMFGRDLADLPVSDERAKAGAICFLPISNEVTRLIAESELQLNPEQTALTSWALVHGLAHLLLDEKIPCPSEQSARQECIATLCHPLYMTLKK